MPSDTELAWVAGFFDGEGSITISPRGNSYEMKVSVTQRDPRPLELIRDWFGGSVGKPYHNGVRNFGIGNAQAGAFLAAIRPYLIVKAEQADVGIRFQSRRSRQVRMLDPVADALDRQELFDIRADLGLTPKQNRKVTA